MRWIPRLCFLIGVTVILAAFGRFCGSALPYQDATPELLAVQQEQFNSEKRLALAGGWIITAGLAWVAVHRRLAAANARPRDTRDGND